MVTHTVSVFALGLVTLFAARYMLPEQLYPWLSLLSGSMVVAIEANLLWQRSRLSVSNRSVSKRQSGYHGARGHDHQHDHGHDHSHTHKHDHAHHAHEEHSHRGHS